MDGERAEYVICVSTYSSFRRDVLTFHILRDRDGIYAAHPGGFFRIDAWMLQAFRRDDELVRGRTGTDG